MNLTAALSKIGLPKVLKSIYPNLNGIDFNTVTYDHIAQQNNPVGYLTSNIDQGWYFGMGSMPMIFQSFSKGKRELEIDKLLINNNIAKASSYKDVSEKQTIFWNGNGFKIESIIIEGSELIVITNEDVIPSKASIYLETKLAKQIECPNWIRGFEFIYDSNTIKDSDKSFNNYVNVPLLFNDNDFILITVQTASIAKAIINRIIEDNGGLGSFEKIDESEHDEWEYLHMGHLFVVGYLPGSKVVRMNRKPLSQISIDDNSLGSGIHPLSDKIQKEIKGFENQIYNHEDGGVPDGRFFASSEKATNIVSFWDDPIAATQFFKKIVYSYNSEDEFLRLKERSVVEWMDTYQDELISFKVPGKCELLLSKGNSTYRINLFPPGGLVGSWEDLEEGDYTGESPVVRFSKNIITQRVSLDPIKMLEKKKPIKKEPINKSVFIENAVIKENIDSNRTEPKSSSNFLKWFLFLLALILLILAFRSCDGSDRDKTYYYNKGVDYAKSGNYEKASQNFEKAIEKDNLYTDPYIKRGEMYLDQKKYNEAIYDFNQAITSDKSNWRAYFLRGCANMELGTSKYSRSYKKSVSDFTQSILLNPNSENAKSYFFRGKVLKIQVSDAACDDFYKACEFNIKEACVIRDKDCYPKTGFMPYARNFGPGVFVGDRRFEIDNSNGQMDMVTSLVSLSTRRIVRSQFVRAGEKLTMNNIPKDKYILKYFEGEQWSNTLIMDDNITKGGFIKNYKFQKIKNIFNFSGYEMRGITFGTTGGSLKSEDISEEEYFN